jgi:uncharacterized membrane protein YcgQ (UPF0703/DUF1980 family)
LNKGFKINNCSDKHCLACSATPPTLSSSVIKNLGITFAKMAPEEVTDEVLNRKGNGAYQQSSQSSSRSSKAKSKKASKDDDTPRKESKK